VVPLAPATVEAIRSALMVATKVQVPAGTRSGGTRRAYVAAQLGHSPPLALSTYGHVLAEYAEADRIDAEGRSPRLAARHVPPEFLSATTRAPPLTASPLGEP